MMAFADNDNDEETVADAFVSDHDVLEGRNGPPRQVNAHLGNRRYKDLINRYTEGHQSREKGEKTEITKMIVREIQNMKGRFLEWNPSSSSPCYNSDGTPAEVWRVLSPKKSREKVSAAIKNNLKNSTKKIERQMKSLLGHKDEDVPFFDHALKAQQTFLKKHNTDHPSKRDPEFDVFCGKGTGSKEAHQLGNKIYVALTKANGREYKESDDRDYKKLIVQSIFITIKFVLGGRFLVHDGATWDEQSEDETKKKIEQACRDAFKCQRKGTLVMDDTPDLENEMLLNSASPGDEIDPLHFFYLLCQKLKNRTDSEPQKQT